MSPAQWLELFKQGFREGWVIGTSLPLYYYLPVALIEVYVLYRYISPFVKTKWLMRFSKRGESREKK